VELISRVLDLQADWQGEIDYVWDMLDENCIIATHSSCATHVHIGVKGGYTLDRLKRIAKTVVLYDAGVTQVMPNERKACIWCQSNVSASEVLKPAHNEVR